MFLDDLADIGLSGGYAPSGPATSGSGKRKKTSPTIEAARKVIAGIRSAAPDVIVPEETEDLASRVNPEPQFPRVAGNSLVPQLPPPPDFASDAPLPPNPLHREIPHAPSPVDLAGIDREERARLESERGPRIKANPKGFKGFLLGLAKGAVGLAEGAARSGAPTFMDALPYMAQGATNRIDAYRTNREDYEPFDAELKQRVGDRVRPLLEQYGQDRQRYEDAAKQYDAETERDRYDDTVSTRDRQFGLQEENQKRLWASLASQDADRKADNIRQAEAMRLQHEDRVRAADNQVKLGMERITDAKQRGAVQGRYRVFSEQSRALGDQERAAVTELQQLQRIGFATLTPEQQQAAQQKYADAQSRLEGIRQRREEVLRQMEGVANEVAPATAASSGGVSPSVADQARAIKAAVQAGQMTREQAIQQLRALGLK